MLAGLRQCVEEQLREVTVTYFHERGDVLSRTPADGGWSIIQCMEHLNIFSAWYHPQIRRELVRRSAGPVSDTFQSSILGNYLISRVMPFGGKKYKAAKRHVPAQRLNAHSVIALFIYHQQELLRYLEKAESVDLDRTRISMSKIRCLKLKLGDMLQFLVLHNQRHLAQARKNYLSQIMSLK